MRGWELAVLLTAFGMSAAACERRESSEKRQESLEQDIDQAGDKLNEEAEQAKEKIDD